MRRSASHQVTPHEALVIYIDIPLVFMHTAPHGNRARHFSLFLPTPLRNRFAPPPPLRRRRAQRHSRRLLSRRRPAAAIRIAARHRPHHGPKRGRASRTEARAIPAPPPRISSRPAIPASPSRLPPALARPPCPPPRRADQLRMVPRQPRRAVHPGILPRPLPRIMRDPQHPARGSGPRNLAHHVRITGKDHRRNHATRGWPDRRRFSVFHPVDPSCRRARGTHAGSLAGCHRANKSPRPIAIGARAIIGPGVPPRANRGALRANIPSAFDANATPAAARANRLPTGDSHLAPRPPHPAPPPVVPI